MTQRALATVSEVFPLVAATWPAATVHAVGPFAVPVPDAGGNRVSAARLSDCSTDLAEPEMLDAAEAKMQAQGRAPLFQVLEHQTGLARACDQRGYSARDQTDLMVIAARDLAAEPPSVTVFDLWPPLEIQAELWEAGGIDAARRAVMDRATCLKTSLLGRINDRPAGVAYVGLHGSHAMLHALDIAPAARRQGLAATMMRAAAHWTQSMGADWLSVLVTRQNAAGQRLYASLGMQKIASYIYREHLDWQATP